MDVDRPAPGEELNPAAPTEPRQAATAILVRDGEHGLEVLLVKRNPEASFMGGAWVFPGGQLQESDAGHAEAALRELEEEARVRLEDVGRLVPFSRWITPAEVKVRFDTVFFVADAPPDAEPRVDGAECVDARWIRPADALEAYRRGELALVFPTIKHLEQLAELGTVEEALRTARSREIRAVQPRIVVGDDGPRVLLPDEPGFER
jgi:8-oxo-dGTP pyrophosphatase MutT (NUDIX family)